MLSLGFYTPWQVAERVRDPYRVAWGLPWAATTMASAPNASMAFTPLVSNVITPSVRSVQHTVGKQCLAPHW